MTEAAVPPGRSFLDRYFSLSEHGTNVRTELVAEAAK